MSHAPVFTRSWLAHFAVVAGMVLSACGGGGSSDSNVSVSSVSGTVSGLTTSGLVLFSGNETLPVTTNGHFAFSSTVTGSWTVTISSQPEGQTCSVSNSSGSSTSTAVAITCRDYLALSANQSGRNVTAFNVGSAGTLTSAATTSTSSLQPANIVMSSDGRFAYASYSGDTTLTAFSVDSSTGALTSVGTVSLLGWNSGLAIGPNDSYVYAAVQTAGKVSAFSVGSNGALTAVSTVAAGSTPAAVVVAVTPTGGKYAYVSNTGDGTVSQFSVGSGGGLTALTTATVSIGGSTQPMGLAVDPDGRYLWVTLKGTGYDQVAQYKIDANTGKLSPASVPTISAGNSPVAIAVAPDGSCAYVANNGDSTVLAYRILSGGLLGSPSTASAGANPSSVAVSPDSAHVYVTNSGANTITSYDVGSLCVLTSSGTATTGTIPVAIAVR